MSDELTPYRQLLEVMRRQAGAVASGDWESFFEAEPERLAALRRLPDHPPAQARELLEELVALTQANHHVVADAKEAVARELAKLRQGRQVRDAYRQGNQPPLPGRGQLA